MSIENLEKALSCLAEAKSNILEAQDEIMLAGIEDKNADFDYFVRKLQVRQFFIQKVLIDELKRKMEENRYKTCTNCLNHIKSDCKCKIDKKPVTSDGACEKWEERTCGTCKHLTDCAGWYYQACTEIGESHAKTDIACDKWEYK